MTVQFYWGSGSPYSWRVHMVLEFKGIPYDSKLLSFSAGEHKSPEYVALNPRGKVPTIVVGDDVVYESAACLRYLEAAFPEPPIFGSTPAESARIARVISEYDAYLDSATSRQVVLPIFFNRVEGNEDSLREGLEVLHRELGILEASLTGDWLAGDAFSAADIHLTPGIHALLRAAGKPTADAFDGLGLRALPDRYPRIAAWLDRVAALPWFDRTYPPHWKG